MTNEIARKPTSAELDGFAGYNDASEGEDEQPTSGGLIVGTKIKFNDAQWFDNVGEKLPAGLELVVVRVLRVVQKWGADDKPIAECTRIIEPLQSWPDLKALNKKCPSEWREKFGEMRGPWQGQRLVYLVDPETMARYTWPSAKGTIGARLCVEDIVDRINWLRNHKKNDAVYPIVELGDTFMPTGYGGRQRPHFIVKGWKDFGADAGTQKLETPVQQAIDDVNAKRADTKPAAPALTGKEVTPPTAKEVTDDEILF
jgi:hypothetical protein